jgi:hypothetical protein
MNRNIARIEPEQFITIWQQSASLAEVAQKTGMPKNSCYSRAAYYTRKGVPMKKFSKPKSDLWDDLAELAETLQEQTT